MSGDVRGVSSNTQPFLTQTNVQRALLVTAILVATVSIAAIAGGIVGVGSIGITVFSSKTLLMTGGGLMALPTAYMIQKIVLAAKVNQKREIDTLFQNPSKSIKAKMVSKRVKIDGRYDHQLVLNMLKRCPQERLQEVIEIIQRDMPQEDYTAVARQFIEHKHQEFQEREQFDRGYSNYSPILYYKGALLDQLVGCIVAKLELRAEEDVRGEDLSYDALNNTGALTMRLNSCRGLQLLSMFGLYAYVDPNDYPLSKYTDEGEYVELRLAVRITNQRPEEQTRQPHHKEAQFELIYTITKHIQNSHEAFS